ncbi:hypothetical protein XELAEV_18045387mg [Xenopus laevis]|uniref:Uncharacterized protein n=1 Tax=Xenopus laevis TaxID=8355 RepID=A0A974C0M3_XENLA|nr:hypothetical protein XELAEV_18045387mg [Xenopus laevis]
MKKIQWSLSFMGTCQPMLLPTCTGSSPLITATRMEVRGGVWVGGGGCAESHSPGEPKCPSPTLHTTPQTITRNNYSSIKMAGDQGVSFSFVLYKDSEIMSFTIRCLMPLLMPAMPR